MDSREDQNRRMLRSPGPVDRHFARPRDVPALAKS